jgi:prolyl oligopeptidase
MSRSAPLTPTKEVVEILHGIEVRDPYRWLEDGSDPQVQRWVAAQNAHARAFLDALPGRAAIQRRIAQAMACGLLGGSVPRGRHRFFCRRREAMTQPALYVAGPEGERVLVDPGPMSRDSTVALDWWEVSADGELVAFGLSEAGTEASTLHVLRVADGTWLGDAIPGCRWSAVAFEPGGEAILYTREPRPGTVPRNEERFHRHLWRHRLGSDQAEDTEVFGQGRDKLDSIGPVSISADGCWCAVTVSRGWEATDVYLRRGTGPFFPVLEGHAAKLYAWFAGNRLLGLTNLAAPRFRLVEIDPTDPAPEHWRDLVPEQEHVLVDAVATATHLAVHHLVEAASRVSIHRPDGGFERTLELPPLSTVVGLGGHVSSPDLYVTVETFSRPPVTLRNGVEVERLEGPAGFQPERYPVRRAWCNSRDGTRIPIFLAGRAGGQGPTVLSGYGGFSVCRTPLWSPQLVPFWEAGGLFALVCLRGGGEFGEAWHEAGRLGRKQNVFDDLIAAAEWLIDQGLASPRQLGLVGGSNGGLLVGAAITQRPDLFGAAVARVPLTDMLRYHRFGIGQLWVSEYGSADDPEQFRWLFAYSPYHRVRDGVRYPATLITTGEEDARVDPLHARKMTARLQAADPEGLVLLRAEPRAGHGQGKPTTKLVPEEADIWAFLLDRLG